MACLAAAIPRAHEIAHPRARRGRLSVGYSAGEGKNGDGRLIDTIEGTAENKVCFGTEAFAGAVRRPCTVTALTEVSLMAFMTEDLAVDAGSATALADRVFAASVKEALKVRHLRGATTTPRAHGV